MRSRSVVYKKVIRRISREPKIGVKCPCCGWDSELVNKVELRKEGDNGVRCYYCGSTYVLEMVAFVGI